MDDRTGEELRILLLEDTPSDAELEESELRDAGLTFTLLRVDTRAAFEQALDEFNPDIVIADYRLPGYNGREALEYERRTHPQIPVIMVTGALGDEAAVELLRLGARDYVLKGSLARLVPAIQRALSEERGIRNRKLAEAAVHESEIRYRRLFEAAKDGILILDAETGEIVDANPFILDLLSYSRSEIVGKMLWEIGLFADTEFSKVAFRELQSQGHIRYEDLPLETQSGQRRDVEFISNSYHADGRKVIQCNIRDITERLLMEKALRESEARYRRITEGLTDYQYTVRIEYGRAVETVQSPACVSVTGYRSEEFAANSNLWIQMVVPEDRERVIERVRHVLAGEEVQPMEHRIIRKDGELRWVHCTIILFRDASGKLLSYDGVVRDVTERKQAEQVVYDEKMFSESLIQSLPDIFFLLDRQGGLLKWNHRFSTLSGLAHEEMLGTNALTFILEEDRPHVAQNIQQAFETGAAEVEARLLFQNGQRNYLLTANRIETQFGLNLIGMGIDITERKAVEAGFKLFRALVDHSSDAIEVTDPVTLQYIDVNETACHMLGYSRDELLSMHIQDVDPDMDELQLKKIAEELQVHGAAIIETRHRRKDGSTLPVEISINAVQIDKDYGVSMVRDITERKLAEANLRESEEKFRAIFDHARDGIIVMDVDEQSVRFSNSSMEQMLGYGPGELIGLKMAQLHPPEALAQAGEQFDRDAHGAVSKVQNMPMLTKDNRILYADLNGSPVDIAGHRYLLGVFRDATERRAGEMKLRRANRTLQTLSAGNLVLVRATSEEELLAEAVKIIVDIGGHKMATVGYALDDPGKIVSAKACYGLDESDYWAGNMTWADTERGQLPISKSIRSGTTQICRNIAKDPAFGPWKDAALQRGYVSNIALPLSGGGRTFGALSIYSSDVDAFDEEETRLLEELANDLAYGITTLRTRKEHEQHAVVLRQSLEQSIQTIAATVEARDPYTAGHQRRVAELATAIASEMNLPTEQVEGIHFAAIIHDLGKIHIPAEILSKPGRLNEIEYMLIKLHPQAGYDILKNVQFPWPIADIVLQHHERLDGSGYPQGLKNGDILLESKILTVADVVEAMSSHRPYRPGLGIEAALDEIIRMRGKYYDPQVVDACVTLIREKSYVIPG